MERMKKLLIMGGSYFLGRVLVEEALKSGGFSVTVLNRGNRPLNLPGVAERVCDRNDALRLAGILSAERWDIVADTCAYNPAHVKTLFSALPAAGAGRYVLISTVSVYAPTKDLPVSESAPLLAGPLPLPGPAADYGFNKRLAEHAAAAQGLLRQIPATILRPAVIYGRYNYAPREPYFFDLVERGEPVVIPKDDLALFQLVYVKDVARAVLAAAESPKAEGEAYNLAAPELLSYGRLVEVLEAATGRRIETVALPAARIDAARIPLPFPLTEHWIHSGEKIVRDLGFSYTKLVPAMRQTYEDYRKNRQE